MFTLNVFGKTLFGRHYVKCVCVFMYEEAAKSALDRSPLRDCPYVIFDVGGQTVQERGLK